MIEEITEIAEVANGYVGHSIVSELEGIYYFVDQVAAENFKSDIESFEFFDAADILTRAVNGCVPVTIRLRQHSE